MFDDLLGTWGNMLKPLHDLITRYRPPCYRFLDIAVVSNNKVINLSALQGVMHDVAFGAGPKRGCIPAQVFWHLFGRDNRPIRRMPRYPRWAIANHLAPNGGIKTLCTDQRTSGNIIPSIYVQRCCCTVLTITGDAVIGANIHQGRGFARIQQNFVQICAVDHRIRVFKMRPKVISQRNLRDVFTGFRIHEAQRVDVNSLATHMLTNTEVIKTMKRIRANLNTSANLAKLGRLLDDNGF